MPWNEVCWDIPLDAKPMVTYAGVGHHPEMSVKYHLKGTWTLHLYRYEGEIILDGMPFPIQPNFAGLVPPDMDIEFRLRGPSVHVFALFQFPPNLPTNHKVVSIRAMQDLGEDFGAIYEAMEEGVGYFSQRPRRTEARIWDILWQLASRTGGGGTKAETSQPAPLQKAAEIIELRLGQPLYVGRLAREVGVSHNHLTNLFHFHFGTTVVGYICERRMQRARQLLIHSTMPIKAIAAEVGIRDLHLFNKTMRRVLGASPRRLRAEASE